MQDDVICAISTPLGKGAVAIVRMSGKGCLEKALQIFSPKNKKDEIKPRFMHFGTLKLDEGEETCLLVFFQAPKSYTGEDCVEFQIHGGVLIAQKVLEKVISTGARLAEAGEFSKRAFLNGKISLDEAEAIVDEIDAESESELKSSLSISSGKLRQKVADAQNAVEAMLAELEVNIDYPEEVDENQIRFTTRKKLEEISLELEKILQDSANLKYVKNGINVALVGQTNVGKSSVLNALVGQDRAIVTDVRGTTRDVVGESFFHKGVKINILDTAGIRETADVVESLGIERSIASAKDADLVLLIVDGSEVASAEEKKIEKLIVQKKHFCVINKSDKPRKHEKMPDEIEISAKNGQGVQQLKDKILKMVEMEEISANSLVLCNERQFQSLKTAQNTLQKILSAKNLNLDIFASELKVLWQNLGKITGKTENEDIINLIFSKFCLGK